MAMTTPEPAGGAIALREQVPEATPIPDRPEPAALPATDITKRIERANRPRRRGRGMRTLITSLAITATAYWYYALTTLVIAIAVPFVAGWHSTTVMSGSMEPLISAGDVVAFSEYDGESLSVGTIIQFEDPVRPGGTVTHRISGFNEDGTYQTKGDSNNNADSTPVHPAAILGIAAFVSPYAGLPQYWLGSGQYGWLAAWAVLTAAALTIMTIHGRIEGSSRVGRAWVRPAIALGLVAAVAGVGTAAWSAAAFVGSTDNADNQFIAANTFQDFSHLGSIGVATCSNNTSTTLTLGAGVPAGSTIIIRYAMRNRRQNATLAATDTQGNAYSVDANAVNRRRTQTAILSTHVTNALASGDQITVTHPRGRAVVVSFDEYAGVTSGARVSAAGVATGNDANPTVTINPADDNTLVIGSVSTRRGNTTYTQPGGWNALDTGQVTCRRRMIYGGAWLENDTAGAVTYNPVLGRNSRWAAAIVAYRSN